MEPISFLIWLIVIVVLLGILWWALTSFFPIPARISTAILILVALVLLVYIASRFGLLAGI